MNSYLVHHWSLTTHTGFWEDILEANLMKCNHFPVFLVILDARGGGEQEIFKLWKSFDNSVDLTKWRKANIKLKRSRRTKSIGDNIKEE